MTSRSVFVSLFIVCVLSLPAAASQPDGPVGKLISNPLVSLPPDPNGLPLVACFGFHWSELSSARQLDPSDTLTLQMAIIPFLSGETVVVPGDAVLSTSFMHVNFQNGLVNGLPYNRSGWNDVTVQMRPATQDFVLAVNGLRAGPFPYESACQQAGGCFTVQSWGLSGYVLDESVALVDSISLVRGSAAGDETLFEQTFDTCAPPRPFLGGILVIDPPLRVRQRR